MRRRLFNIAAVISLLLCMAVFVLWARSYRTRGPARWVAFEGARGTVFPAVRLSAEPGRYWFVGSERGRMLLIHQSSSTDPAEQLDASNCGVLGAPSSVMVYSPAALVADRGFLGFGSASNQFGRTTQGKRSFEYSVWSVPFWAAVVLTMILPAWWLRRRRLDRRRARLGLCHSCGYDLRASLERCPECGAVAADRREVVA